MNSLVYYSSATGNTELIAKTIYNILPNKKGIFKTEKDSVCDDCDILFLGFWVDKGTCDDINKEFVKNIHNKKIALFGTMGADSDEGYGGRITERIKEIIPKDNEIIGEFTCRGKLEPKMRTMYEDMLKLHPEKLQINFQIKNYDDGKSHPDEKDLLDANEFVLRIVNML